MKTEARLSEARPIRVLQLACMFLIVHCLDAGAQTIVVGPNGQQMVVETANGVVPVQPGGEGQPQPGGAPANGAKDAKGAESKAENEQPEPKVIRRGEVIDENSDPDEFKAQVGPDGKVAFQFRNQRWPELVQWLSDISDKPMDWLELPADRVNLATPGRYTVEETKDLFNRHLLTRGYTILDAEGGMAIVKTETINPAMVPRVDVMRLASMQPHTYVRTSLDVGWLSAEQLSKELAPMISANGKLTAMSTTNRIEAMDAVANLQDVAKVLEQERSIASREALAPEFELRYLPAEEAKLMLESFLGIEKKKSAPMTPQQMQMMQRMRQQGVAAGSGKKPDVSIVANVRRNSLIIRAPADRTAVAMEFLKRIDVPSEGYSSLTDIQTRFQVFRLASLDPEKLIEIINDMNVLEPATRIRADKKNNALIVSGGAADRFIINSLIERLDGSGRNFHVLQLRRLDASDVAESISFLMGQDKGEDDNSRSRYGYYGYYGYGRQEEERNTDEFRVAANARFRQVLLWANDSEMEQVESLLIKLGELPPPGGSKRTMRMIDAAATPETYEYLKRLQKQWNATSTAPLELPDPSQFKDPIKDQEPDASTEETDSSDQEKPDDDVVNTSIDRGRKLTLIQVTDQNSDSTQSDADDTIQSAKDFDRVFGKTTQDQQADTDPQAPSDDSPVRIQVDRDGNLVLMSSNTVALDQLENMMLRFKPPRRPYSVFKIKHASAFWIRLNLEDFFKNEDEDGDSDADSFYRWYWDMDQQTDDGPSGLGKGNKLKFVDDPDTNTIVASGATTEQLRTIAELIELWDVEEPTNKRKIRYTELVSIKYGKASDVAETVKEAYRDLLSSNDKSFGRGGGGGQGNPNAGNAGGRQGAQRNREGNGSGLVDRENGNEGGGADFSFKGKLSIGVDPVGNTLLVSAEGESLLKLVVDMIGKLDEAVESAEKVDVYEISGNMNPASLKQALEAIGVKAEVSTQKSRRPTQPPAKAQ